MKNPSDAVVKALHRKATIFLSYMNPAMVYQPDGGIDASLFFQRTHWGQGNFPRLRAGGVKAAVLSFGLNDPDQFPGAAGICRLTQSLGAFLREAQAHKDEIEVARTVADIRRINAAGKMAVLLHLTGVCMDGRIELLEAYHAMGVRSIHTPFDTVASTHADAWKRGARLTPFARNVIRRMQQLGMMVDLAHASEEMFPEILRLVKGPVIVSHGMCRAISDTKRNLSDEQILAVAATGGVIGVHFASWLMDDDYRVRFQSCGLYEELHRWVARLKKRYPDPYAYSAHRYNWPLWVKTRARQIEQSVPMPPFERIVDHIDHMVGLVGVDHVGVGTDYDLGTIPQGVDRADKLPNLTKALLRRGYSPADIRKIWGDNFLRVYRQALGS